MAGNTLSHGLKLANALGALAHGSTKREAAESANIGKTSLNPCNLSKARLNPILQRVATCHMLDMSAQIAERTVSLREALSRWAERLLVIVATLGPRDGVDLTRDEQRSLDKAITKLAAMRGTGLWREDSPISLPGELQVPQAEEFTESILLMDTTCHDQAAGKRRREARKEAKRAQKAQDERSNLTNIDSGEDKTDGQTGGDPAIATVSDDSAPNQ